MKKFLKSKRARIHKLSKNKKKKRILKRHLLDIYSPHNTNDFLINNNSSPFFSGDEEEEETIMINPNSPLLLFNDANTELNLLDFKESRETESTEEKVNLSLANKVQIFLIQR